jgi:bifunctional ADP-heptose synthase (sugar kinase/adenylyltransferase)
MSLIKVDPAKLQAKQNAERIAKLKQLLADTDFVALSDYDKDKPDVLAQRQAWREEIRELEGSAE